MTTIQTFHINPKDITDGGTSMDERPMVPAAQYGLTSDIQLIQTHRTVRKIQAAGILSIVPDHFVSKRFEIYGYSQNTVIRDLIQNAIGCENPSHPIRNLEKTQTKIVNVAYLSYLGLVAPIIYISVHNNYVDSFTASARLLDKVENDDKFSIYFIDMVVESGVTEYEVMKALLSRIREEVILVIEGAEEAREKCEAISQGNPYNAIVQEVQTHPFFVNDPSGATYYQNKLIPLLSTVDDLIDELTTLSQDSDKDRIEEIRTIIQLKTKNEGIENYLHPSISEIKQVPTVKLENVFPSL